MSVQRQRFNISTDTGSVTDTGPAFSGAIQQVRWEATTGDTGADLQISLLTQPAGDTGNGWIFFEDNDCLGSDFTRVPLQTSHGPDGLDTGVDQYSPIVAAGDRLRVKVTPGGAAVAGTLFVWTYSG
jgi:hypothetical protein